MGYNIGYGITNDGSSIYVSGTLKTKDERSDIYVAKLDTSLNIQWEKQSIGNSIKNICYGIISDNEKNVYVTGTFRDSIRFGGQTLTAIELWSTDIFIAKFSENGENMWAKGIYSYDYGFGYSIDFDHKNSIYVSGYAGENAEFSPTFITGKEGPFLAKLTKGGDYEYVKSFYTGYDFNGERGTGHVSCDKNGNLFFATNYVSSLSLGARLLKQGLNPLVKVYPNPCRGTLNTRYISGAAGEISLQVYNIFGQEVFATTKNTTPGNNNYQLDLSALQPGMYFLSISKGQKTVATNKFIIEQ